MVAPLTDEQITRMAKARVSFKMHAVVYVLVNLFLVMVYFVTSDGDPILTDGGEGAYYWPVWTHLGWGLGLAIHGFTTYGPGNNMLAREEEKLRQQFGKS